MDLRGIEDGGILDVQFSLRFYLGRYHTYGVILCRELCYGFWSCYYFSGRVHHCKGG